MMRIWVIRHGESETNRKGLWTGWLDAPLTEKGKQEAASVGKIVSQIRFDKIYSSDLRRAKDTANIALPDCECEETAMLREINVGNIAGQPFAAATDGNNRPMNENGYGCFGGESNDEFRARVTEFMKRLDSEKCESIAVFSHGGVLRKLLEITLGVQPLRGSVICRNCAVAIFEVDRSVWKLHGWMNLS